MLFIVLLSNPHLQPNVYAEKNSPDETVEGWLDKDKPTDKEEVKKNQDENEQILENEVATFSIFAFFKMLLALIFVIFLIYFLLKFINKKGNLFNQYRYIQNIGGTSLGSNRSIQLVKAGNRILVVGVGDSIQLLKEIDDDEEIKEILADHNNRMDQLVQSKDFFKKVFQEKMNQKKRTEHSNQQFGVLLKEQLQELTNNRKKLFDQMKNKENHHNE